MKGYKLVIMIGTSRDRCRMSLVSIAIVSASQPQISFSSSYKRFHARQGVVSEKCDSLRQFMPAA